MEQSKAGRPPRQPALESQAKAAATLARNVVATETRRVIHEESSVDYRRGSALIEPPALTPINPLFAGDNCRVGPRMAFAAAAIFAHRTG